MPRRGLRALRQTPAKPPKPTTKLTLFCAAVFTLLLAAVSTVFYQRLAFQLENTLAGDLEERADAFWGDAKPGWWTLFHFAGVVPAAGIMLKSPGIDKSSGRLARDWAKI